MGWDADLRDTDLRGAPGHPYEEGEFVDSANIQLEKPLYEQVRDRIHVWREIGTNATVLSWIENGVFFPTTRDVPCFHHSQLDHDEEARKYWHTILKPHYIRGGAIRRIPAPPPHRRHVSRCFFVEKTSGGYRLVIDLRFVNLFFDEHKIKFENLSLLKFANSELQFGAKVDLSDAHHHLKYRGDL